MSEREKLIEILETIPHAQRLYSDLVADYILENGVAIPIRCKNCRYYNDDGEYCGMWGEVRHPEHYCEEGLT